MRSRSARRSAVSEVVSSLAVLAVTIALLGGIATVATGSIKASGDLLSLSSRASAAKAGLLLSVVSVQSNGTGTYAWVYDYGWAEGTLSATYVNGGLVAWTSTCGGVLQPGALCAVVLPSGEHGQVDMVFGTKSLGFAA